MIVIINTSNPNGGDTYNAKAREFRNTASSTNSRAIAVEYCAKKIAGKRIFSLKQITSQLWVAVIEDKK